jgi:hypothetical protein
MVIAGVLIMALGMPADAPLVLEALRCRKETAEAYRAIAALPSGPLVLDPHTLLLLLWWVDWQMELGLIEKEMKEGTN